MAATGVETVPTADGRGLGMDEAVLKLDKLEEKLRFEDCAHDTEDNEDHTFSGFMCNLICKDQLPCEYVEVQSVWVRGDLGPITVYTSEEDYRSCMSNPDKWTIRHRATYESSFHQLVEMKLDPPLRIDSGKEKGLYVHSTRHDDQAIVYDNARYDHQYNSRSERRETEVLNGDKFYKPRAALSISVGQAHLSDEPFGGRAPWGSMPWRPNREFVGRISYGVRWMLWNPTEHHRFPAPFRAATEAMLMGAKRPESELYNLRDEVIFFIMNRCGWDWWGSGEPVKEEEEEAEQDDEVSRYSARFPHFYRGMGDRGNVILDLLNGLGMNRVMYNGDGELVMQPDSDEDEGDEAAADDDSDGDPSYEPLECADGDSESEDESQESSRDAELPPECKASGSGSRGRPEMMAPEA